MPDPAAPPSGLDAFAALLRERIPDYPARGSLEAFATRCGGRITGPQIGQYARGEREPTLQNLKLLCKGMGVPLLFGFSVLAGLDSAEKVPPPNDLHELSSHIARAADLMNQLMIRSVSNEHGGRRRPRPRTDRVPVENNDGTSPSIHPAMDSIPSYDQQAHDNKHIYEHHQPTRQMVAA